ncbi:MAG: beta-propeller domain-containing protein, partial [Syntrophomonas sp.]
MNFIKNRPPVIAAIFILTLMAVAIITFTLSSPEGSAVATSNNKTEIKPLPTVGSFDNLKKLLEATNDNRMYRTYAGSDVVKSKSMPLMSVQADSMEAGIAAPSSNTASQAYSSTNIQVAGVDEADIVKTDGTYIYQVSNQKIVIAKAYPATEMKVVNNIKFDDQKFSPTELYVDPTHLVVVGTTYTNRPWPQDPQVKTSIYPPYRNINSTLAIIYDISDKSNIKKIREVEIEGSCVSSRKIGQSLYLVANRYIDYYYLENGTGVTPVYRDTARGSQFITIDYPAIHYFPEEIYPNYIIVAGIKLDSPNNPADIQTYLGSGDNIYSSADNLYVSVSKYNYSQPVVQGKISFSQTQNITTEVYKFGL